MCQNAFFSPTTSSFLFIETIGFNLCKKSICFKHSVTAIEKLNVAIALHFSASSASSISKKYL